MTMPEAVRWREGLRERGQTLVFTNGVFDVLHAGHVAYLAWAREQGDALIVGVNDDASVRMLKGNRRPIVPLEERMRVLAALRSVDAVVPFAEATPEAAIEHIRPDVHVKSAQYREDDLPERSAVLRNGGRIALAPHLSGTSTTETIAAIVSRYCA
ncbi:MAG: adenylyltransferase/cytidyltransferase family protein [Candidatus Eremiobacteraeota bacterium]|nr:adenylyltransferase/cytidyltransferase family protein [Candidatus Eremiobacteraeota bacterium]